MVIRVRARSGSRSGQRATRAARVVDSIAAVAEFAGVTVPSASAWFERGAPTRPDGRYDLLEITRWHALNVGGADRASSGSGADGQESRQDAERRLRSAQADTAEMDVQQRRGQLVARSDHDRDMYELVDAFVSALENLPPKVGPLLTAARGHQEIDQILRDHIRTMRIQLVAKFSPKDPEAGGELYQRGERE